MPLNRALLSARRSRPRGLGLACAGVALAVGLLGSAAQADTVHIAVASNFSAPAQALATVFEKTTGHKAVLSHGATGKFYAQIRHGAPFAVLLAADTATPRRLEDEGLAVRGSTFVYATGRLVLWSPQPGRVDTQGDVLRRADFKRLALANPSLAPYGLAAQQTLQHLGLAEAVKDRLVTGDSIGQAFAFVASGNADLGLVALSQLMDGGQRRAGSQWLVPEALHAPIAQGAVLLKKGEHQAGARAWLDLLKSPQAQSLVSSFGYTPK